MFEMAPGCGAGGGRGTRERGSEPRPSQVPHSDLCSPFFNYLRLFRCLFFFFFFFGHTHTRSLRLAGVFSTQAPVLVGRTRLRSGGRSSPAIQALLAPDAKPRV